MRNKLWIQEIFQKQKTHPQHLLMNCYAYERLVFVLVAKSYLTLCDPMDCGSPVPLFTGFLRQEYWNGLPFSSPGDLPNPGIELRFPELQADSLPAEPQGKPRGSKSGPAGNSRKMVQIQLCGWEGFSWMGPLWSPVGYSQGDFCLQCWLLIFLFQYEIFKNHSNVCLHFCYKYSNIVDSLLFLSQSLFFSSFFLPGNHR